MKHFNIATDQGIVQVFGNPLQVGKFKCFYVTNDLSEFDEIIISEYYSGMKVCGIITPDFISPHRMALELLSEHDEQAIIKHCKGVLQHNGMSYPINK